MPNTAEVLEPRFFAERVLAIGVDLVVVTEFRNNVSGKTIRSIFSDGGLPFQSLNNVAPRQNSVLIAAAQPFDQLEIPGLEDQAHRGVLARFESCDVLGFYFPGMKDKIPIFDAICSLDLARLNPASCILGDINTGRHYLDKEGATFIASEYFDKLESLGWVDTWRTRNPIVREYSWYSNAGNGFRLDHAFATKAFDETVTHVKYIHDPREEGLSDHSAMVIVSSLDLLNGSKMGSE